MIICRNAAAQFNSGSVNANIYLTNLRSGGTIGIAWVGAVCASTRYRTSINTYFYGSDTQNGYVRFLNFQRCLNVQVDFLLVGGS